MPVGFDSDTYVKLQSQHIKKRISEFGGKLYLEFGGKLFDDYHAARVLPGFLPDGKINMLHELKEDAEIVIVINSKDIEKNKIRGDIGITYDLDVLRLIDAFRSSGLYVGSVVLTQFAEQPSAVFFLKRLEILGIKTYKHYKIDNYPEDIQHIISNDGYGKNEYIETSRSLIIVTAPGPASGKMATCLSQLFHEHTRGIKAGYAKFETFPIWNLPLKHPVNMAYEAATADLEDVNLIDPFHLEAYGTMAVNYNRDVEVFPILNAIFQKIYGKSPYKSPTDMGVNMAGFCITDDEACREASKAEIIRRYFAALCTERQGLAGKSQIYKTELLMRQCDIKVTDRKVVEPAINRARETGSPAAAIQLACGKIITGRTSPLLGASSAMLLNALKELAGLADDVTLISPSVIEPIQDLKVEHLGNRNPRLHTDELLVALSICAVTDENAKLAMSQLKGLKGCEMHSSVILSEVDLKVLRKLGINLTCEPVYQTKRLYQK